VAVSWPRCGVLGEDAKDEVDGFRGQVVTHLLVCLVRCELDADDRLAGPPARAARCDALGEGFRAGEGDDQDRGGIDRIAADFDDIAERSRADLTRGLAACTCCWTSRAPALPARPNR
jgi:hypothetical protein